MKKDTSPENEWLRRGYLEMLRRRARELRQFADRCLEGQLTSGEIEEVHLRVHSLVGSGATYGYPGVSVAADSLNRALESPTSMGLKKLSGLTDHLIEMCKQTLEQFESASSPAISPVIKSPPPESAAPRPVLLAVDDDAAIHDLVKSMFKDSAHIVTTYNGDEALEAMRRHCPDLILLDHYMPGMDGLRLLETMSEDRNLPPIPIIMLTASASPKEIMRAAAAGAADYIAKPFEPRILADKIGGLMRRSLMTVLIASGNAVMRRLVANKLRRMGLSVMEAANGEDAVIRAQKYIPELILLDQSASTGEGTAALHALRGGKRTKHIPMLYVSSDHADHAMLEGLNTGTIDRTVIPFSPEKVTARVLDALGLEQAWA